MRGRGILVLIVSFSAGLLTVDIGGASSCAPMVGEPDVVFIGTSLGGEDDVYRWRVEDAIRGVHPGEQVVIEMHVDVRRGDFWGTSSMSLGPEPVAGRRYQVEALRSESGRLYASACGGSLQREYQMTPSDDYRSQALWRWIAAGWLLCVGAAVSFAAVGRHRATHVP